MPSVLLVGTMCPDIYIRCVIAGMKCSSVVLFFCVDDCGFERVRVCSPLVSGNCVFIAYLVTSFLSFRLLV